MKRKTAILAAGCFWGVEHLLAKKEGVVSTRVGYTGGHTQNPTYQNICTGQTGHAEAVEVVYDPQKLSYEDLLLFFFQLHDPTTPNKQGHDVGSQYRSAIFVADDDERQTALDVIAKINASGKWPAQVCTTVEEVGVFYPAEENHQKYLEKNPYGYSCHFIRPEWTL